MRRRAGVDDLLRLTVPGAPALSPDGTRVAYVLRRADPEQDRDVLALWQVDRASGEAAPLTAGPADTAPAWSPDGRQLAFLRAGPELVPGPPQLWLLPAHGGEARRLTDLPLGAGAPVWSPDGRRVAFTAEVDPAGTPDPTAPVVTDRLDYQPDGSGLLGQRRRHVHVVDLEGGPAASSPRATGTPGSRPGRRTAGGWPCPGSPAPTRTSAARAGARARRRRPDPRPQPAALAQGTAGTVLWTPDGAALVVVGTVGDPAGHARLLRVPLDGGDPVDLAAGLDRNVMAGGPATRAPRPP